MSPLLLTLLFSQATIQFHLPSGLLTSVCYVETSHKPASIHYNDGTSNSIGICQIKLSASRQMGFKGTEADLLDPTTNIYYAGKFLSYQLKRYKGNIPRAVTAYNKGHSSSDGNSAYYGKVYEQWKITAKENRAAN